MMHFNQVDQSIDSNEFKIIDKINKIPISLDLDQFLLVEKIVILF